MYWHPIETAPKDTKKMFVVKACNIKHHGICNYTSDPYCVWYENGAFVRWPHEFQPTHWFDLPPT